MSEKLSKHERVETIDYDIPETAGERPKDKLETADRSAEQKPEHLEAITKKVEEARPNVSENVKHKFATPEETLSIPRPDDQQKQHALSTYLGQVRHHLSAPDKSFSKFVHNPKVNAVSEVVGNTIVRPSGILTGSALTLIGSIFYLYATEHTGYDYSFTLALALFVGGFIIGLVGEYILKLFSSRQHSQ